MADLKLRGRQAEGLPVPRAEYYQIIRGQIDAENNLSSMRVIWLLIAEAFFSGAYATLLNAQPQAKNPLFASEQDFLFWLLPMAALLAGLLALAAVVASTLRISELQRCYEQYEEKTRESDRSTQGYPPLQDGPTVHRLTVLSLIGLPTLFILLWAAILVVQCIKTLWPSP